MSCHRLVTDKTTIGTRGEILPSKSLRQVAGFKPGDHVFLEAREGQIIVRKVFFPAEIMARPPIGRVTADELERELDEEEKVVESMVK